MTTLTDAARWARDADAFRTDTDAAGAVPIHAVRGSDGLAALGSLSPKERRWAEANAFKATAKSHLLLADGEGDLKAVLFGLGADGAGEPCGPDELLFGELARKLPPATYALGDGWRDPATAALAWGLGSYRFEAYKKGGAKAEADEPGWASARLVLPNAAADRVQAIASAIWRGRDLINTPANDMGPEQLEAAAVALADRHGAASAVTVGNDLLAANFPLIHAVGRASTRPPRLIDVAWGREDAPRVTIVGKGVCFDTGGLDLKPPAGMLLMKKDMGGAAAALALADMVMTLGLDVRLRLLIPAVENAVSGDAFRPGDIITSRQGLAVEIGNTDAEGRLVLADALSLGAEENPELMMTFATLTGAARVALGPDLPPCFVDDDGVWSMIQDAGMKVGDPVWRMPFWPGYDRLLDSPNADLGNVSEGAFAGAVTAALFLKRFAKGARHYAHFDIYGWRPAPRPLGPKGGEPHAARTMLDVIEQIANKGGV
jgi:leucyl aminopeptidase